MTAEEKRVKLGQFLDRVNRSQPLPPVAMYYLGIVTAMSIEADYDPPDGVLFDLVLHITDRQKQITRDLTTLVVLEAEQWAKRLAEAGKAARES